MNAHQNEVTNILNTRSGLGFSVDGEVYSDWSKFFYLCDSEGHVAAVAKFNEVSWYQVELTRLAVREDCEGKGWSKRIISAIEQEARLRGLHVIQATTRQDNFAAQCLLYSMGYRRVNEFFNRMTSHAIVVWQKVMKGEF